MPFDRKEYNRKNAREWAINHPERRYETNKKWAENNKEKADESRKKYAKNNPDKIKESKRNWKKNHPEAVLADKEKRRAIMMNAPGRGVTAEDWKNIMRDYNYKCVYCGKGGRLTMDHIVPLIKGGAHDVDNIVPACMDCNCKKNSKDLIVFLNERWSNAAETL